MVDRNLPYVLAPEALAQLLGHPDLLLVDLNDRATFAQAHLPGAVQLDYALLIQPKPPAGGLMAPISALAEVFSRIGLKAEKHVVAYDKDGNARAARLLWTLEALGHTRLSLLDGGLPAWQAAGLGLETGASAPQPGVFKAHYQPSVRADKDYILAHLKDPDVVIVDCRSPAEYSGQDKRAARGGHIPGAVNFDWTLAFDASRSTRLKPEAEIKSLLAQRGIVPEKEAIVHCQTHGRSSHTYWVLRALGFSRVRGYDGSWSEWGNDPSLPIETG
jgi:thiosulfate/3-mercaptopyruvate sulfurtransferase